MLHKHPGGPAGRQARGGRPRARIAPTNRPEACLLPISLTVRNFLSYKEGAPTLRLEDVHVACLCGANGVGKSALLDAITWALWGRARGQRQEQLVHHGQQEMSVALEFAVGETRYYVTRRYSRARRTPQSSLELTVPGGRRLPPRHRQHHRGDAGGHHPAYQHGLRHVREQRVPGARARRPVLYGHAHGAQGGALPCAGARNV